MSRFQALSTFEEGQRNYRLLPMRFTQLAGDDYVVTNMAGEFATLERFPLILVHSRRN